MTLLDDAGAHPLPRMDKLALARRLVAEIARRLPERATAVVRCTGPSPATSTPSWADARLPFVVLLRYNQTRPSLSGLADGNLNIYDVKTRLSQLVDKVVSGEDVVVSRDGKPLVRITRLESGKRPIRFGVLKGKVQIARNFDSLRCPRTPPHSKAPDAPSAGHSRLPAGQLSGVPRSNAGSPNHRAAEAVFVSAASIWEVAIKARLGKIKADPDALVAAIEESGFVDLPVSSTHAAGNPRSPLLDNDPFYCLLIAQAIAEPLRFLTADVALKPYSDLVNTRRENPLSGS